MRVEYNYLPEQFANSEEIIEEWRLLIQSGDFTLGQWVLEIEGLFAKYVGAKHAIAVNNGTDALLLALKAIGVGPGQEVITPCNSFYATTGAIVALGAKPVFCDVDSRYQIDLDRVEELISGETRCILPVHWAGASPDMNRLVEIADKYSLYVVEDACMGIGSTINGKSAGTFGKVGAYSLHPLKSLNVMGDGGFVTTSDDNYESWMRTYRNHGMVDRDHIRMFGLNHRMQPLQAIVAKHQLRLLPDFLQRRRSHAKYFDSLLLNNEFLRDSVLVPERFEGYLETFSLYMLLVDRRDELVEYLNGHDIDARIHYPIPLHLQEASNYLGYKRGDFPVAEEQADKLITLPMHQYLDKAKLDFMYEHLVNFFGLHD